MIRTSILRCLPALAVAAVLTFSALAPIPTAPVLVKHCGYGYAYGGHCK